jgi:hypothetical protein
MLPTNDNQSFNASCDQYFTGSFVIFTIYNFYEKNIFQQNKRRITTPIAVSAYILDTIPHKTTKCAPLEHNTLAYIEK